MAIFVLDNAFVSIGGNDVSAYVRSVTLGFTVEKGDATAMGANTRKNLAGLKDVSLSVELNQDFVDDGLDEDLWTLFDARAAVAVIIKSDAGATSAANPRYYGQAIITSYAPIGGAVGDVAVAPLELAPAGDWTRAITD